MATRRNKKGLTPIISIILLLMMAVSTAAGMFYWLTRIQGQQQGAVESFQSTLFQNLASAVDVVDADYNDTTERLDMFLQNTGNNKIILDNSSSTPTTEWILFDSGQRAVCATNWGATSGAVRCVLNCGAASLIEIGQIRQVALNLSGSNCDISSQPNGSVLSFTLDFSGVTTTAGSFIK